jgi:hypothetical protein
VGADLTCGRGEAAGSTQKRLPRFDPEYDCSNRPCTTVTGRGKGFDWDVLGRLHEKGMIHDPVGKVKSVVFTQEGLDRAKQLFETMFET